MRKLLLIKNLSNRIKGRASSSKLNDFCFVCLALLFNLFTGKAVKLCEYHDLATGHFNVNTYLFNS